MFALQTNKFEFPYNNKFNTIFQWKSFIERLDKMY